MPKKFKLEICFEIVGLKELRLLVERIEALNDRELIDLNTEAIAEAVSQLSVSREDKHQAVEVNNGQA